MVFAHMLTTVRTQRGFLIELVRLKKFKREAIKLRFPPMQFSRQYFEIFHRGTVGKFETTTFNFRSVFRKHDTKTALIPLRHISAHRDQKR